jgi:hypothetical protein
MRNTFTWRYLGRHLPDTICKVPLVNNILSFNLTQQFQLFPGQAIATLPSLVLTLLSPRLLALWQIVGSVTSTQP